ncbi:MAG: hypothetical protein IKM53_01385 [Clostridia bacterium]|nr:hypothetical protein [Clostridia bacterium]
MEALTQLFLKVFNMSVAASWIVMAVMVLRLIFRKAPKFLFCVLWGLVALRLVVPFSFESILSLVPSAETVPANIAQTDFPVVRTGISALNSTLNPMILENLMPKVQDSVNPMQVVVNVATAVWLTGTAAMLGYAVFSYVRLRREVAEGMETEQGVWVCDRIPGSFILGVFRPRIYLSSDLQGADREYVLAHERAHIKRFDHLWKPLGFVILCLHWFNILVWFAYALLCRDIELACDERVIRTFGEENKKAYSMALINCSTPKGVLSACPLAFGETGVKARIKSVLNYKKPTFWVIFFAVLAVLALCVFFLTNPKDGNSEDFSSLGSESMGELPDLDDSFYALELEEVVGEDGMFSSVLFEDETEYTLVLKDGFLYSSPFFDSFPSEFARLNLVQACEISLKENFDSYFSESFEWEKGYSAELLRIQNKKTYSVTTLNGEVIYLMIQKDGSKFVAYSYLNLNGGESQDGSVQVRYMLKCEDYAGEMDELLEKVTNSLALGYRLPVLDALTVDLDGDGDEEQLSMTFGPTSGLMSVWIHVSGIGGSEGRLSEWFYVDGTEIGFVQTENGIGVKTLSYEDKEKIYRLSLVDGKINLVAEDETGEELVKGKM